MVKSPRADAVERPLPRMPKRCVSKVMPERDSLRQILIQAQRPGNCPRILCHLKRMCQPCAIVVALRSQKNLRLPLQPPKRLAVQDTVAVALIDRTQITGFLHTVTPP